MAEVTTTLETTGMHCQSCAMLIEMNVADLPGVSSVRADYVSGDTEVTYDSDQVAVDAIVDEIVKAGYGASPKE
jgi:copper chaperone CopZ